MRTFISILLGCLIIFNSAQAIVERVDMVNFNSEITTANTQDIFALNLFKIAESIDRYNLAQVSVRVIVTPPLDNASFDEGKIISMPRMLQFTNSYGLDPYIQPAHHLDTVFAHEYAHAIFDQQTAQMIPLYSEMSQILIKQSDLQIQMLELSEGLSNLEKNTFRERLRQESRQLTDQIKNNSEMIRLRNIMSPYNELFADVVAVYYLNDKSAIFEALFNPNWESHQINLIENVRARDFATNHLISDADNSNEHALFGPTRTTLGKQNCWPKDESQKSTYLKILMEFFIREIDRKFNNRENVTAQDNLTLMKEIETKICRTH